MPPAPADGTIAVGDANATAAAGAGTPPARAEDGPCGPWEPSACDDTSQLCKHLALLDRAYGSDSENLNWDKS